MAIIVTRAGVKAQKLSRAPVTVERDLQTYVVDNPECLPIEDLGEDLRLLVLAREVPTGAGPIDAVGTDQEGHIYLIETKLYKNPDKRLVLAQVLDYGAALWAQFGRGGDFGAVLERSVEKTVRTSLRQHIEKGFELAPDQIDEVLVTLTTNVANGNLRFIVLMDRIDDRLKDLIAFVNANSQFSVYGVELEFYHHGDDTIVIPKLHGAQVRKQTTSVSPRRTWDEEAFFAAAANLPDPTRRALRELFDFCRANATSVPWGSGGKAGSFNPKFELISEKSVFTVFTTGKLQLNFGWLHKADAGVGPLFVRQFGAKLREVGFSLPADYEQRYVTVEPDVWVPRLPQFKQALLEAKETLGRESSSRAGTKSS
jgi:hypothetical protein